MVLSPVGCTACITVIILRVYAHHICFLALMMTNVRDREAKGRNPRGEKRAHAKLDPHRIRAIRAQRFFGESYNAIAREFGVAHTTVQRICKRQTWTHV